MLLIVRSMLLAVSLLFAFVFGGLVCLLRPRHRDNVHMYAKIFASVAPILGLKVIVRRHQDVHEGPYVFLGNHQNNYDLFTHTQIVPKSTVSLGKKSLAWIPLFGQMYWLSGNILIDRKNRSSAFDTMAKTAEKIKRNRLSVWIFPEGTRSRGRGLLPFKAGAFHTAIAAGVPVVPVLASCQSHINLNRWDNGVVIIEMMAPIPTEGIDKAEIKTFSTRVHAIMSEKFNALNHEAAALMGKTLPSDNL